MACVQILLSTVSAEFRSYRDALRRDLTRPNVAVQVQEDFIATGTETLDKLDEYIRQCRAVIHLVGHMTGALARAPSVAVVRQRYPDLVRRLPVLSPFLGPDAAALPYTQWEAWLALYHHKALIIAVPQDGAPRDDGYRLVEDQRAVQQAHLTRLAEIERYPEIRFADCDRLTVDVLRSKLQDILALPGNDELAPFIADLTADAKAMGLIVRGHLLRCLIRQQAIADKLTSLGVSLTDLRARLEQLLARVARLDTAADPAPTGSVTEILGRARDILRTERLQNPELALWTALAENTRRLLDAAVSPSSRSSQEWIAFIISCPGLAGAMGDATPYT